MDHPVYLGFNHFTFVNERLPVLEVDEGGHGGDGDLGDVVDVDVQELDSLPGHLLLHAVEPGYDLQRHLVQFLICEKRNKFKCLKYRVTYQVVLKVLLILKLK